MVQAEFVGGFPPADVVASARQTRRAAAAVTAYRFFYPAVSMEGLMRGTRAAGGHDNEAFIILDTGPRHVMFTPNSDTPYGGTGFDLRESGPMVIDMPPGRYLGLVDDHYHRWVADMGLPGPDAGAGGKYVIVPPGWNRVIPDGYHVRHSSTWHVMVAVRALPGDGGPAAALESLRAVKAYPLSTADTPTAYQFVDVSDQPIDLSLLAWEDNIDFWHVLADIIDAEPPIEEFRPIYGLLAELGIIAGEKFLPDDETIALLAAASRQGLREMLATSFAGNRPERVVWPDRQWEWAGLQPDNGDFESPGYLDLDARDRWFAQAIVASPAMFRRKVGFGSLYWLGARDYTGTYLDGGRNYRLTVPTPVPAGLFWSMTVYDPYTRSQLVTRQGKAALRSSREDLTPGANGTVDLYFGPQPPVGHEDHWLQTVPGQGWFSYFRIYGPGQPAFDGTWRPGDIEPIDIEPIEIKLTDVEGMVLEPAVLKATVLEPTILEPAVHEPAVLKATVLEPTILEPTVLEPID